MPLPRWAVWVLLPGSCVMLACGLLYAAYAEPICGTNDRSARFSIRSDKDGGGGGSGWRILTGNSCPGYDWTDQSAPNSANAVPFEVSLPLHPTIAASPQLVGVSADPLVGGAIGYALDGVPLYGPSALGGVDAIEFEGDSFGRCAAHNAPKQFLVPVLDVGVSTNASFGGKQREKSTLVLARFATGVPLSLPPPLTHLLTHSLTHSLTQGYYHYHGQPGDQSPVAHRDRRTADLGTYCPAVQKWYGLAAETAAHSPLVGFMADGIPIYGPAGTNGEAPSDLDACNGHASDDFDFYHYHMTSVYP